MFKPTKKQHVVNKAYADKNGSGIDPFKVTLTGIYDESTDTFTYTCDKSYGEVNDWWNTRMYDIQRPCIIKTDGDIDSSTYYGRVMSFDDSTGVSGYLFIVGETDTINMYNQPPVYNHYIDGYSLVSKYNKETATYTDVVEFVSGAFEVEFQPEDD